MAFKCLTMPDAPVNEGCFRSLNLISPEGTMLNAKPPAAIGLWSIMLPTVIDTILKALAPAMPDTVPAAHKGDMGGVSFYGYREGTAAFPADEYFRRRLGRTAHGRRRKLPRYPSVRATCAMCRSKYRKPIFPFIVEEFGLRADSGGTGKHRGGFGTVITYRCLQKTSANINLERIVEPPWGILGGGDGEPNVAIIRRIDGSEERGTKETNIQLKPATGSLS